MLHSGDRSSIFAHLLAGQRRRQAILERRQEREGERSARSGGRTPAPPSYERATPLDAVLEAMEKALGGEQREAALEAASQVGAEAFEVERTAHSLRFEGRNFAQIHALRNRRNLAAPGPSPEAARQQAEEAERLARIR